MATITQRLAFLISANAEQAIKAFDKTAATAEKQMGKAGKSIDKLGGQLTKFGAAGLAASGVIGQQLFKAGQAASDLSESMNKTRVIFGGASKDVEAFASNAADKLGLSKRAALDAASTFATFGKAAGLSGGELTGFSKKLVTLSADLASFYNTSPEDAILAIGAALRGESEPIRRYGVLLNDAVLKQEMFALTGEKVTGTLTPQQKVLAAQAAIFKQTTDAQGDAIRTGDGLAMTQKRLQASVENLQAEFGEAAIPVIKAGADAALAAASGFNKLNDATGGVLTKLATFGTVGLGVVSTASLIAGQAIKLRDRFGEVDAATGQFTGNLTKLGKAVATTSAVAGTAAVVYSIYASAKQQTAQATNDFVAALEAETDAQPELLKNYILNNKYGKDVVDTLKLLGLNLSDVSESAKGNSNSMNILSDAMDVFLKSGSNAGEASEFLSQKMGRNIDLSQKQFFAVSLLVKFFEDYKDQLEAAASATHLATTATQDNTDAANDAVATYSRLNELFTRNYNFNEMRNRSVDRSAALMEYQSMLEERAKETAGKNDEARAIAAKKFADEVDVLADKLEKKLANALKAAEDNAANANKAYDDYRKNIAGSVSGVVSFGEAQATAETNTKKLAEAKQAEVDAQTELNKALAAKDADPEKIAEARQKLADATKAVTDAEKAPLTFGDALKGQVTTATDFKSNLQKVLDLGGDQALVDQLTAAGADAGNAIIKGILASSDPKAKVEELDATLANVAALADTIGKASADKFYGEGVRLANELLRGVKEQVGKIDVEALKEGKNPKKRLKQKTAAVDTSLGLLFGIAGLQVPSLADGGIVPARPGGTLVRVGEGGQDEAVLPLPRMQGGSSIVINVTAGMGADGTQIGRQIVDELVAYQRRVGALPIKVAG
jgi:hypothetical protein